MRGAAHKDTCRIRDAWRILVTAGPDAVPAIRTKLRKSNWKIYSNAVGGRYLMILLGLLNQIDPTAAKTEITRLDKTRLHPLHANTLKIAKSWIADTPYETEYAGIVIAVSSALDSPDRIAHRINKWLSTPPPDDLATITRIDVVPYQPEFNYGGYYSILFSGIVLVWPEFKTHRLLHWAEYLHAESTLYHEIGHHALGHSEGGQIKDQEDAANTYSNSMLRHSHRKFRLALRPITLPVKFFRWLSRRKPDRN